MACKALVFLASTAALSASAAAWGELNRCSPAASRRPGSTNMREVSASPSMTLADRRTGEELQSFIGFGSFVK
jgi:hypothetical protein